MISWRRPSSGRRSKSSYVIFVDVCGAMAKVYAFSKTATGKRLNRERRAISSPDKFSPVKRLRQEPEIGSEVSGQTSPIGNVLGLTRLATRRGTAITTASLA